MVQYIPYIFTKDEILEEFKNEKQLNNWLLNKQKSRTIAKVRNGLYVYVANSKCSYCSKFEVASKISKDAYLAYHSALEYYGLGNNRFYEVYVCSSTRFNNFIFEGVEYIHHRINKNSYIEIETKRDLNSDVRVTSLERTIIDCIDNVGLAGGIEELLHALSDVEDVDEEKMLKVLETYNSVILYQKCGYILEHFKNEMGLSDNFFNTCKSKLTNQVKYFLKGEYHNYSYSSKWKLVAPTNLLALISGGF